MSKTMKIAIAIIIIIAVVIVGCFLFVKNKQEKHTGPIEKLTIGSPHQEISSLVYLAKEQGYFEKNGLDVEIKEAISESLKKQSSCRASVLLGLSHIYITRNLTGICAGISRSPTVR